MSATEQVPGSDNQVGGEPALTRDNLQQMIESFSRGEPVFFKVVHLVTALKMSIASLDREARERELRKLLEEIVAADLELHQQEMIATPVHPYFEQSLQRRIEAASDWLKSNAAPEAPCETPPSGEGRPATPRSGQANDAQPLGAAPMPENLKEAADRISDAAERMVATFRHHAGSCSPCTINWQSLRDALATYQTMRSSE